MTIFNLKTATKWAAMGVVAVGGFLASPAGNALVKQYPHLDVVAAALGTIAALLHVPVKQ